ncbi:tRNA pseudouridine synthase-like 1, partial [Ophiophagus hannah]
MCKHLKKKQNPYLRVCLSPPFLSRLQKNSEHPSRSNLSSPAAQTLGCTPSATRPTLTSRGRRGSPPSPKSSWSSVLSACRVSSNFHARFLARARTYIYRVATGCTTYSDLPVFERDLCWANRCGHLNLAAMQEAATFLVGTHDFSTFCSASSETLARSPIKTLNWVEVRPSQGFLSEHSNDSNLKFWELEFVSRSFLYKQVRRMVGALVAVGQSRLQPHHIQELLAARDLMAYPPNTIAPPYGLFLKHVEYYKSDLETED